LGHVLTPFPRYAQAFPLSAVAKRGNVLYYNNITPPLYEVELGLILCRICSPFFATAEKGAGGMSTCDLKRRGLGG